jgi:glycosyltransferase involved in cell wall biosynthesis
MVGFNEAKWLPSVFRSIARNTSHSYELVYVDDASTDDTKEKVEKAAAEMPELRYVRNEERVGVAGSRIRGTWEAQADVLTFVDAHVWVRKRGSFDLIAETVYGDPKNLYIPAMSNVTIPYADLEDDPQWPARMPVEYGGGIAFSAKRNWFYAFVNRTNKTRWQERRGGYVCGMTIHRTLLDKLGGWLRLPGFWSGNDAAMSILCWYADQPYKIETEAHIAHAVKPDGRVRRAMPDRHQYLNYVYGAAALFPDTWESFWKPTFRERYWKEDAQAMEALAAREHERVRRVRVHGEQEFLEKFVIPRLGMG